MMQSDFDHQSYFYILTNMVIHNKLGNILDVYAYALKLKVKSLVCLLAI